jgi:hypothetical protein
VLQSGEVSIDGEGVTLAALPAALAPLKEGRIVDFYREGWATKMHPNSDVVLSELVDGGFLVAVCARPDCPP